MNGTNSNNLIKSALDRLVNVYRKRPDFARSTEVITGTVNGGLACTISDGSHEVRADMPQTMGGTGTGPSPGYYARAGIAGCISIGIKMQAARAGYDFRSIQVDVETDFDDRAFYDLADCSAAPLETRLTIVVECDLEAGQLETFIAGVLERDTWYLALRDAQSVKTRISAAGNGQSEE